MVRRKSGRNSTALEQKHLLFLVGFLIFACVALHLFFHYFLNSTQPEATGPFRELSWPSTKNRCHQIAPVAFNLSVSQVSCSLPPYVDVTSFLAMLRFLMRRRKEVEHFELVRLIS